MKEIITFIKSHSKFRIYNIVDSSVLLMNCIQNIQSKSLEQLVDSVNRQFKRAKKN